MGKKLNSEMKPLKEVIAALQRELEQTQAARLSATLQCAIVDEPGRPISFAVLTKAEQPAGPVHSITVEIQAHGGSATDAATSIASPAPVLTGRQRMVELLTKMFGPPGFDNAA